MIEHTFNANGSSASVLWGSGKTVGLMLAGGNFGGGTLSVEVSAGAVGFVPVSGVSLTAAGAISFEFPADVLVRMTLSGATAPNVNAVVQ